MIPFIQIKGPKVSSALNTERLKVALWQNACLNFWAFYLNEEYTFTLTKSQKPVLAEAGIKPDQHTSTKHLTFKHNG